VRSIRYLTWYLLLITGVDIGVVGDVGSAEARRVSPGDDATGR